jgi:hypothetical protein
MSPSTQTRRNAGHRSHRSRAIVAGVTVIWDLPRPSEDDANLRARDSTRTMSQHRQGQQQRQDCRLIWICVTDFLYRRAGR